MIVTEGRTYRLAIEPSELDATAFTGLVARGMLESPADRIETLDQALNLWRGRPFQPVGDDPSFAVLSAELLESRRQAEEYFLEALLEDGRNNEAANRATVFVDAEPYRERRWELLMLALYRSGQQAEALRAAQRARTTLGDDLGLDPGPGLQTLEAKILAQDPDLFPDTVEEPGRVDSLILDHGLPPTVPVFTTPFVGRADELKTLAESVEEYPWVALTGPPGCGKTRLVSRHCRGEHERRTIWLNVGRLEDGDAVARLASLLNIRPADGAGEVNEVIDALVAVPTLLVLDAATIDQAALITRIVSASPTVRVISVSRDELAAEQSFTFAINGLDDVSAAAIIEAVDGVTGEEAARAVEEIGTTAQTVELFAAQLRAATVDELLDDWRSAEGAGNDDVSKALDWSVGRLTDTDIELYEQLGAFASWNSTADIAQVVGGSTASVRRQLQTLVDAGLLRSSRSTDTSGRVRYRLPLLMRNNATARLEMAGRYESARTRHAEHFTGVADQRGAEAVGPNEQAAIEHLNAVSQELHHAFEWMIETNQFERATAFVLTLHEYAFFRLDFETLEWSQRLAERQTSETGGARADVLAVASLSAWAVDRSTTAKSLADQAARAAKADGSPVPITALRTRLNVAASSGDGRAAVAAMDDLLSAAEETGTARDLSDCLVNQALGAVFFGDQESALNAGVRALDLAEESQNPTSISWAKYAVGCAELLRRPEPALVHFAESLRVAYSVDNKWLISSALGGVATGARLSGRVGESTAPLSTLLDTWIGLRKDSYFVRTLNEVALVLYELEQHEHARTVLTWAASYSADPLLLPADRAQLRLIKTELAPPLTTGPTPTVREIGQLVGGFLSDTTSTASTPG